MERFEHLKVMARYLFENTTASWDLCVFSGTNKRVKERTPQIYFLVDVKPVMDDVRYTKKGFVEEFVHEIQIEYKEKTFIFEVTSYVENGVIVRCFLDVSTPAGDGKGAKVRLMSKTLNIC